MTENKDAKSTGETVQSLNTDRWWSNKKPSLRERISALFKAFTSGRFDHELKTAISVRPRTPPFADDDFVHLSVYKIWFVLHYDEIDEDRTTNLYIRKIGDSHAPMDRIHSSTIHAGLLPLQNDEWANKIEDYTNAE